MDRISLLLRNSSPLSEREVKSLFSNVCELREKYKIRSTILEEVDVLKSSNAFDRLIIEILLGCISNVLVVFFYLKIEAIFSKSESIYFWMIKVSPDCFASWKMFISFPKTFF